VHCRYLKEQNAWFQRAEDPLDVTDAYERGDVVYFDSTLSEDSWVFRLRKDFTIAYSQVQDDSWFRPNC
jgi:CCR4-NOT transcriptional regulation complex NOT5 subunit